MANNFVIDDSNSRLLPTYLYLAHIFQKFVQSVLFFLLVVFCGHSICSVLPSGLNCLQRNIPCYRGSPICEKSSELSFVSYICCLVRDPLYINLPKIFFLLIHHNFSLECRLFLCNKLWKQ